MRLLNSWQSISGKETHSLPLTETKHLTTVWKEARMNTAKSTPWFFFFTILFNILFNSKRFRTYPYGCCTHFSSSQTKTTFEGFITSWISGPFLSVSSWLHKITSENLNPCVLGKKEKDFIRVFCQI